MNSKLKQRNQIISNYILLKEEKMRWELIRIIKTKVIKYKV